MRLGGTRRHDAAFSMLVAAFVLHESVRCHPEPRSSETRSGPRRPFDASTASQSSREPRLCSPCTETTTRMRPLPGTS